MPFQLRSFLVMLLALAVPCLLTGCDASDTDEDTPGTTITAQSLQGPWQVQTDYFIEVSSSLGLAAFERESGATCFTPNGDTGQMEILPNGRIAMTWTGEERNEYNVTLAGDVLTLTFVGTNDSFTWTRWRNAFNRC